RESFLVVFHGTWYLEFPTGRAARDKEGLSFEGLIFICSNDDFFRSGFELRCERGGFDRKEIANVFLDVGLESFGEIGAGDGDGAYPIVYVQRYITLPAPLADDEESL